ncbi:peptide chain release factor N(5)-glutamine methyltransferase [Telmatospirillum sp.]|uniref:peptide chain release factor N(5)-glutamine methyltransferase n=1 Tax=Telmatospirillum sp. TaxID=2079197 RepID=UPI00284E3D3F|nr:peptide chain release factor N(5)-glutamine methyltransferase [Telmatospirillum sp.]MDR3438577.1 peptide chain release factor N(5)-glutamine methyltransferase [Telmatospirillum sp.]
MTRSGDILLHLTERLRSAGVEQARLDARLLLAYALGVSGTDVFSHPERVLSADDEERVLTVAERRIRREPMSHILGRREFWSMDFKVTADTLDPRPDTETLVEAVLERIDDRQAPLDLLDLGTGTGCILLALLSELPTASGVGVDGSLAALAVARENARTHGLSHRAGFVLGDWGRGIERRFDIILSNPPYIPDDDIDGLEAEVALFEPRTALAGGPDGLDCYRALAPDVFRLLKPGGFAALEVGKGQAEAVGSILAQSGLDPLAVRRDLAGVDRCVMTARPPLEKK